MSVPISGSFSKLSLSQSDMQSTRGQVRSPLGQNEMKHEDESDSDNHSEDDEEEEGEEGTQDSEQPEHVLALYHCRQIGTKPSNNLYAFQVRGLSYFSSILLQTRYIKLMNVLDRRCTDCEARCEDISRRCQHANMFLRRTWNLSPCILALGATQSDWCGTH